MPRAIGVWQRTQGVKSRPILASFWFARCDSRTKRQQGIRPRGGGRSVVEGYGNGMRPAFDPALDDSAKELEAAHSEDDSPDSGVSRAGRLRAAKRVHHAYESSATPVPPPNFRYVALEPTEARELGRSVAAGAAVGLGVAFALGQGPSGIAVLAAGCALSGLGVALRGPLKKSGSALALVPWGLLVDSDENPRALLWSSVRSVRVRSAHGHDGGHATTVASFVTVETARETFFGRTPGEANLERLEAHLSAYADEQSTPVALDIDGTLAADVTEADGERLLSMASAWIDTGHAHERLGLHAGTYRKATCHTATPQAVAALRRVLRESPARLRADPRAFAAIVAAELGATELVTDLLMLVQSPHPLVAAFAKGAARRLGAPTSRVGSLDEIVPFLLGEDERVLRAWGDLGAEST